jgi:hypothetical protein
MRKADVIAGLSVSGLMLPEAVAYAAIAGLPPGRAVFAGIAGCLAYALVGRSPYAILSPTSSAAAILAGLLALSPVSGTDKAFIATAATLLAGGFFLVAALLRLGGLSALVPRPVLKGFAFGIALTIIIKQVPAVVGAPAAGGNLAAQVWMLWLSHMQDWHVASLGCGVLALGLYGWLRTGSGGAGGAAGFAGGGAGGHGLAAGHMGRCGGGPDCRRACMAGSAGDGVERVDTACVVRGAADANPAGGKLGDGQRAGGGPWRAAGRKP